MQKQADLCGVEANLVYTVRQRTAKAVRRSPVSKKGHGIMAHTFNPLISEAEEFTYKSFILSTAWFAE